MSCRVGIGHRLPEQPENRKIRRRSRTQRRQLPMPDRLCRSGGRRMQHRFKRHSKVKILAHNARQAVQRLQKSAGGIHVAADDIRIQPLPERAPADLQIKIPASVAPVQKDASFMRPPDRRSQRAALVQNRLSASLIDMAENVPGAQRIRDLAERQDRVRDMDADRAAQRLRQTQRFLQKRPRFLRRKHIPGKAKL